VRERTFWKSLALLLGASLGGMVLVNALGLYSVPWQLISFTASCLFCIGVGNTVVSPKSSRLLLDKVAERRIRIRQLIIGLMISVLLVLFILIPEVHEESIPWVLVPIIALTPVMIVRELIIRVRRKRRRAPQM